MHFCQQPERNTTVWAALPRLIESQVAGFEALSVESRGTADIVMDLTEARVLSVDLINVVRSSDLDYNVELAGLIQQFAEDALTVSRDLQRLSAKIGTAFDQITSTNAHMYRLIRTPPQSSLPHSGKACRKISTLGSGIEEICEFPELSQVFDTVVQTYERVLRDLMYANGASLMKVSGLDADLISVGAVLADEKQEARMAEHEFQGQLLSVLRLNERRRSILAYNTRLLDRVGEYTERSLRFVRTIQTTLEGMQREVEELRAVVAQGGMAAAPSPEIVLDVLSRGLERLNAVKVRPGLEGSGQREVARHRSSPEVGIPEE
ncbi:uncharacterized protein B0H18DRAFT_887513 [Fomitopsis serialis]|uniref:uncharacterized protein n=1 Tax=Fomitopsis serialis TaxID=139415 RepID=UPI00200852D9|nr:uncharacterized protein B0H18DRAFT_887513 [Neoantrodia serialis]KAH9914046.1 hypothetical protein B0H18DRAFT_887513 [Neoantrodia serialis]